MAVKIVKSVARVLEILELYNEVQEPLAAVDVAERLNYPLASTHEILKTMVELGFFSYGTPKWTYRPSMRFPEVVDWVKNDLSEEGNIHMLMESLNDETLETINLSQKISNKVKIVKGLECRYEIGVSSKPGTVMEATQSLTGITSLSHLNKSDLEGFYSSLKQTDPATYKKTNFELIDSILDEISRNGCAMRSDININGIGAVCCPILSNQNVSYVLGIVGPSERISENSERLTRILKTYLRRCSVKSLYPIK